MISAQVSSAIVHAGRESDGRHLGYQLHDRMHDDAGNYYPEEQVWAGAKHRHPLALVGRLSWVLVLMMGEEEFVMMYDAHGCGLDCSFCETLAIGELEFKFPDVKKVASIMVCEYHRMAIEAGCRAHRKWQIRGGKDIVKEKLARVRKRSG